MPDMDSFRFIVAKMRKVVWSFIPALFFLCFFGIVKAQDTVQIRQYIRELSDSSMYGRGYAYRGDSIAADYLRRQFRRLDIAPFCFPDYYERYSFPSYAMEGKAEAILDRRRLEGWKDFALAPFSRSAHGTFRILPISPQTLTDSAALASFCADNEKTIGNALLYVDVSACLDEATVRSVYAFCYSLFRQTDHSLMPFQGMLLGVNEIPAWSFSFPKLFYDYVLCYVCADKMTGEPRNLHLSYNNRWIPAYATQNVCAQIPGTQMPDSFVVIGAHYDHLGQMGDEVLFPGCHDNASGVATLLDMAAGFQQEPLRYTVLLTLFSGEEAGLLGSSRFVQDSLLDFSRIALMLNLDLLCGGDEGITLENVYETETARFFKTLDSLNKRSSLLPKVNPRKNAPNSDHYPFSLKGVPAVFFYTNGGKTGTCHQPDDTSENASLSACPGIVRLLTETLRILY